MKRPDDDGARRPGDRGMSRPDGVRPDGAGSFPWGWCLLVLLVASCLRPALTSVGPVVEPLRAATGLSAAGVGLLGALPLLAFAVLSPVAALPAQRVGLERAVLAALAVLAAGILVRSTPGPGLLWVGTLLVGAGIAVQNVVVPVIVKRDFPGQVSVMTGMYTAVLSVAAALAAGFSEPLAAVLPGGWRTSLALWAVPAGAAGLWWAVRTRARRRTQQRTVPLREAVTGALPALPSAPEPPSLRRVSMLRSPTAWAVTLYMGLQSAVFYTVMMWLPSMEARLGVGAAAAGWHLFTLQVTGILGNLSVSFLAERRASQSWLAMLLSSMIVVPAAGALLWPGGAVLWCGLVGIGCGGGFSLSLAMMGLRTVHPAHTLRLSGMSQCLGYLLAATGPLLAGSLAEATGSWAAVLWSLLVLACVQFAAGVVAGRNRRIGEPTPPRP